MKFLRIVLLVASLVCFSGFLGIFVPLDSLAVVVTRYGADAPPSEPLFEYVFRLGAAVMAACGFFYLVLASDPRRFGILVPVSGGAILFVGLVLLGTGFSSGMLSQIFIADFLSCVVLGSTIVVTWLMWGRGRKENA